MKPAPLQLTDYFITKLNLEANQLYSSDGENNANLDTIDVSCVVDLHKKNDDESTNWRCKMSIKQNIPEGRNIPYTFELELQGEIFVFPSLNGDRLETIVKANAPAMLFGAAREIIRAATGRGPFPAVVIPSTNFLQTPAKKSTKKATIKKVAMKKAANKKAKTKKNTK